MKQKGNWMERTIHKVIIFSKKFIANSSCFFALASIIISFLALAVANTSAELAVDAAQGKGWAIIIVGTLGIFIAILGELSGAALLAPEGIVTKGAAALGLSVNVVLGLMFLICLVIFNELLFVLFSLFAIFFLLMALAALRYVNHAFSMVAGSVAVVSSISLILTWDPFLLVIGATYIMVGMILFTFGMISFSRDKTLFEKPT